MWATIKPWGNQFRPACDCLINCIPYQRGHLPSISLKQSPIKYSGHHVCYMRSSRRILSVPKPWTIFFFFFFGCWVETEQGRRLVREQQLILQIPPKVTPVGTNGICYQQIYQDLKQEKIIFKWKLGQQHNSTVKTPCRRGRRRQTQTDFQGHSEHS